MKMENKMQITDIKEGDYVDVTMRLKMVNGVLIDYLKRNYSLPKAGVKCVVAIEKSKDSQILQAIDLLQQNGYSVGEHILSPQKKSPMPWDKETPPKFKIGDRVRVIKRASFFKVGDIGTVIEIDKSILNIDFGKNTWWFDFDRVEPLPNDWIDWHGGECPVDGNVKVEVELRSGYIETRKAKKWTWERNGLLPSGDIIKYRII